MKSDDTPMYDDSSESAFVRELLHAGRRANVEYDVERGLAKHLATISAGTTAPYWVAGAVAAKRSVPLWVGYVTVPLAAAGVAGLLWVFSARPGTGDPARSTGAGSDATAFADSAELPSAGEETEADSAEVKRGDRARARDAAERRSARSIARPTPASARGAVRSHTSGPRGPSEAPAAVTEGAATTRGEAIAANPYASHQAAGASREEQLAQAAIQNTAAPRAPASVAEEPEPAAEPDPDEEAAARPAKQAAANRPIVDESRLEREMQMLAVTQRVLTSDPERALRLAEQGEREFAGTMFSAERRQLALLAMVKLGRLDEARRAGRPFLARYPKAPWSERLRRALATGQVE
jgi:hypothetical protein